jgi:Zn-dependent protease
MATRYRVRVERIDINMGGGLVQFRGWPHSMRQEFLITLAGPLSNLVLGLAAIALLMQLPAPDPGMIVLDGKLVPERFPEHGMLEQLLRATAYLNIGLCVVNLLPGIPLDGGKLVYLLVERRWNTRTALLTVSSLGMVFACINGFLLIGTILAGCPVWAPPAFSTNREAFQAARRGRGNWDAVTF